MKRSPLQRKTPLKAKGGLKRTGGPARRSRVKTVSDRRVKLNETYRPTRDAYMAAHPVCEYPNCSKPSTDPHHIRGRGVAPDLLDDPGNLAALCSKHHRAVTDDPELGRRTGLVEDGNFERRSPKIFRR